MKSSPIDAIIVHNIYRLYGCNYEMWKHFYQKDTPQEGCIVVRRGVYTKISNLI